MRYKVIAKRVENRKKVAYVAAHNPMDAEDKVLFALRHGREIFESYEEAAK